MSTRLLHIIWIIGIEFANYGQGTWGWLSVINQSAWELVLEENDRFSNCEITFVVVSSNL
jgi:hypothetical protein